MANLNLEVDKEDSRFSRHSKVLHPVEDCVDTVVTVVTHVTVVIGVNLASCDGGKVLFVSLGSCGYLEQDNQGHLAAISDHDQP